MEDKKNESLLTADEVAEHLQMSLFIIRKYLRDGEIKGIKLGRKWRVRMSEVEKFIDRKTVKKERKRPQEKEKG